MKSFQGKTIEFEDGTKTEYDVVVFATGFKIGIPFLEPGIVEFDDGIPKLVNGVLVPKHRNLYVFGVAQARYGAGPLISLGSMLLARLIKAQDKLDYPLSEIFLATKIAKITKRNNYQGSFRKDVLADPHTLYFEIWLGLVVVDHLQHLQKLLLQLGWLGSK